MNKETIIKFMQENFQTSVSQKKWNSFPNRPCHKSTVQKLFGSWNNAIKEANLQPNQINQKSSELVICLNCYKSFYKQHCEIKKTSNHFCSQSCAATYHNTHKTKGTRKSKLEVWIEEKLKELYPQLEILFCDKTEISSELDIYFPTLKLAFELNGIFHYKPIFGEKKFSQIQNNDNRKFATCIEKEISLFIIDTSSLVHFKPNKAQKYLDIITDIINQNLNGTQLG